jgi:thiol:disulfide interchange protein DsbD
MFGYYEIQLPKTLQNFANKKSDASKGGGIIGIAIMGALSALIVGPCVAPPLAAALMFIGQTGDVLLGGLALFLLGLGMGAPLLLIGAGGGKFMPKPGGWMTRVSYVFGVVMLGIAISFLSRILPNIVTMLLWALLFIGSGVYAGALEPFKEAISGFSKLIKVLAVVLLGYGLILLTGAFTGGTSVLDPLKKLYTKQSVAGAVSTKPLFSIVKNRAELDAAIKVSTKPVLLDFSAEWCAACHELDEITFEDKQVQALMQNFTLLRIDVTQNSDEDKALQKRFSVVGPPAIIFYDSNHNEIKNHKMIGYKPPSEFISILKNVLGV